MTQSSVSQAIIGAILAHIIVPWTSPAAASMPSMLSEVSVPHKHAWRVIYFWSATCPCVRACERYSFISLAQKYKGKVSFYAIATNGYDLQLPRKQLDYDIVQHHLPYPVLLDVNHTFAKYFDAKITPQTFVLDPAGHVVFDGMPDDSRRFLYPTDVPKRGKKGQVPESYLAKALAEGLAGKAVTETPLKEAGCSIAW